MPAVSLLLNWGEEQDHTHAEVKEGVNDDPRSQSFMRPVVSRGLKLV
jgi:hypothetical protein